MRIAIIGSRGIPAKYGGFETVAEQLSVRLAERGHSVVVACEYESTERRGIYRGVQRSFFPLHPPNNYTLRGLYEMLNDLYFMVKLGGEVEFLYSLGYSAGLFMAIVRLLCPRTRILVNIDGVEWRRSKFSCLEKAIVKLSVLCAIVFSDVIGLDSRAMVAFVPRRFRRKSVYMPNGVDIPQDIEWRDTVIERLTQHIPTTARPRQGDYWLVVARLEPENRIDVQVKAYIESSSKRPLVIVGDFTSRRYRNRVYNIASRSTRILFLGSIYDQSTLNMLRQHAFGYLHGHSVGGTNPSLLEAMIMKNLILAHGNVFNREVCGESALYFEDASDLQDTIDRVESDPEAFSHLREEGFARARAAYSWEGAVSMFERTLAALSKGEDPTSVSSVIPSLDR